MAHLIFLVESFSNSFEEFKKEVESNFYEVNKAESKRPIVTELKLISIRIPQKAKPEFIKEIQQYIYEGKKLSKIKKIINFLIKFLKLKKLEIPFRYDRKQERKLKTRYKNLYLFPVGELEDEFVKDKEII